MTTRRLSCFPAKRRLVQVQARALLNIAGESQARSRSCPRLYRVFVFIVLEAVVAVSAISWGCRLK